LNLKEEALALSFQGTYVGSVYDNALFLPPENVDGLLMILKLTVLIKNKQTSCKRDTGVF